MQFKTVTRFGIRFGAQFNDGFENAEKARSWATKNCPGFWSMYSYQTQVWLDRDGVFEIEPIR